MWLIIAQRSFFLQSKNLSQKYESGNTMGKKKPLKMDIILCSGFTMSRPFMCTIRRRNTGCIKLENAKPYAKGEGHSLMVADFISADYGWLQSPNGKESTHILFRAGKGHDGYFNNKNIHSQAAHTMVILKEHYPHEDHVLILIMQQLI
jgi:hypothetical protein